MFGRIKKNRAKRALKGEREGFRAEKEIFESQRPGVEDERERAIQSRALEQAKSMKEKRIADRSEGRQYAQNVLSQDYQGLTPQQRQNMESTGNRRLSREVQGHERRLLAEQGRKGIRGGTAYAQRADL